MFLSMFKFDPGGRDCGRADYVFKWCEMSMFVERCYVRTSRCLCSGSEGAKCLDPCLLESRLMVVSLLMRCGMSFDCGSVVGMGYGVGWRTIVGWDRWFK